MMSPEVITQVVPMNNREFVCLTNHGRIFSAKVNMDRTNIHWLCLAGPDFENWTSPKAVQASR